LRKRSTRAAGRPAVEELEMKVTTRQKRGKAVPKVVSIDMQMELVAKLQLLEHNHFDQMTKFLLELPGNTAEVRADETVKIRFENFDGPNWSKLMDHIDSIGKNEPERKRFKSEVVDVSCENAEEQPVKQQFSQ